MVSVKVFRRLTGIFLLAANLLFIGCSSFRTFEIEVLEPAPLTLTAGKKIGFLDRNIRSVIDSSFILYTYPGITPDDLAFMFYTGLSETLAAEGNIDSLQRMYGKKTIYKQENIFPGVADPLYIRNICQSLDLNYIVALEYYYYDSDEQKGKLDNNYCIRLYGASGEVLDSVRYREDLVFILMNEELDFVEYMRERARERGMEYAVRMVPHWERTVRRIYQGGKILRMGDMFFETQPEQAVKLWEAATKRPSKQAIQAYINLAWVAENQGDFQKAYALLEKASLVAQEKKMRNTDVIYLEKYKKIIRERIEHVKKLNEQM